MTDILPIVTLILLVGMIALLVAMLRKMSQADPSILFSHLDSFQKAQERTERLVREEMAQNREELGKSAKEQRQELTEAFKTFGDSVTQRMMDVATLQKGQLDAFSGQLMVFARESGERLDLARAESATGAKQLREEVVATLSTISETMTKTMTGLATGQKDQLETFANQLGSFAQANGERLDGIRAEFTAGAKLLREEVVATLKTISETMAQTMKDLAAAEKLQLEAFSGQIASLTKTSGEKLDGIRVESATGAKQLREEVIVALKGMAETTTHTMSELANMQKAQLEAMSSAIGKLSESNEKKLEAVRLTVEEKLHSLQIDNAKQLDQMRQTVDEKLQGTLDKRLGESFKQVSDRLEQVYKGLGEMQSLATGVGDLKRVLTNVKTRGTWGEVQLGALLEQVLTPEQYAANVATKHGGERVEYAIRLPGRNEDDHEIVWLPIDAKFPMEDYQRLLDAQEKADAKIAEDAAKALETRIKQCAADICGKYLNPPKTTDFGILFLPTEGLFAEVVRRPGLAESVQRECRVVIAGPTTLWSILNSLQMGFRTLAIQKRSSEVWNLLSAVKTEWSNYGEILDKVKKKLHEASNTVEKAQARTRAVGRKLKEVQQLPATEAQAVLMIQTGVDVDESYGSEDSP